MASSANSYEFCMGFIAASKRYKDQYVGKWREIISNFIVEPLTQTSDSRNTPYRQGGYVYSSSRKNIILKDPETHKLVMTYASKLALSIFGDARGEYVRARAVGWEDAPQKAPTITKLLRYDFALEGHYRTMVESLVDMIQFGTSVLEVSWKYEEREILARSVSQVMGQDEDSFQRVILPVYDDVCIRPIDVQDFYPDPSRYRIEEMCGAAKRFKMNAYEARRMAASGIYLAPKVEDAIGPAMGGTALRDTDSNFRTGLDQPSDDSTSGGFGEMIGYEYWGEVSDAGYGKSSRRVVTILNNEVVRDDLYPYADPHLPFHTMIINPVQGRFYGLAPAEVVRYDQSFADAMKILLAEAIIRQVHPPIAFDPAADVDTAAIRAWKPDALVAAVGGPNAIGTLKYDANVQNGFAMLDGLKSSIQDSSGALGAIQGEPGPDREAASVGMKRMQFAMDRPELAASLIERDCLPALAKAVIRRNQQFLDFEGLLQRVGEMPEPSWIGDIMGDFDIEFVGSRMSMTRQLKLQSWDRLTAMATAIPPLMVMIPWQQIAMRLIGDDLELPEVAADIATAQTVMANMAASAAGQIGTGEGGAAGNGVAQQAEPAGAPPEQMAGGIQ